MKPISFIAAAIAVSLASAATPASAANWIYVDETGTGTVHYYDADTLARYGNQVRFWERIDHSRDKTRKEREVRSWQVYDCKSRMSRILQVVTYYPNGKSETVRFSPAQQPLTETAITPGTLGEAMLEAVCAATAP